MDFDSLPNEILVYIFHFLSPADRQRTALVSKRWNMLSNDDAAWKAICMAHWANSSPMASPITPQAWKKLFYFHRTFKKQPTMCISKAWLASSTDFTSDGHDQGIENTLIPSASSQEWVSYDLYHPLCVVRQISVQIYRADWQFGHPIYAPQRIRFAFGLSRDMLHYETKEFTVAQTSAEQTFEFPQPVLANFIKIDLLGRTQRQPSDGLFYTVLKSVRAHGYSIRDVEDEDVALAFVHHAQAIARSSAHASKSAARSTADTADMDETLDEAAEQDEDSNSAVPVWRSTLEHPELTDAEANSMPALKDILLHRSASSALEFLRGLTPNYNKYSDFNPRIREFHDEVIEDDDDDDDDDDDMEGLEDNEDGDGDNGERSQTLGDLVSHSRALRNLLFTLPDAIEDDAVRARFQLLQERMLRGYLRLLETPAHLGHGHEAAGMETTASSQDHLRGFSFAGEDGADRGRRASGQTAEDDGSVPAPEHPLVNSFSDGERGVSMDAESEFSLRVPWPSSAQQQ